MTDALIARPGAPARSGTGTSGHTTAGGVAAATPRPAAGAAAAAPSGTPVLRVVRPGPQTTVQDLPGRIGLWAVGVPPSGAFDDLALRLANLAVGNDAGAPGLEAVLRGPVLEALGEVTVAVTGSAIPRVNGTPVPCGYPLQLTAGAHLDVGPAGAAGLRSYVAVRGALSVPRDLGSASTFLLGRLGGHEGRALCAGDVLPAGDAPPDPCRDLTGALPEHSRQWTLRVLAGPHGAPDHLTEDGWRDLLTAVFTVDHRSDRTGVRLNGPVPGWSRPDGGDAGLHPSNIHDSPYPVGGIMLAGSTPVVVGPDGPSLGGFCVPAVLADADRWKLAQLRPGDTVRWHAVTAATAARAQRHRAGWLAGIHAAAAVVHRPLAVGLSGEPAGGCGRGPASAPRGTPDGAPGSPGAGLSGGVGSGPPLPEPGPPGWRGTGSGVPSAPDGGGWLRREAALLTVAADGVRPALVVRRAGERHVLVELGDARLDLGVRVQAHLLALALQGDAGPDHVELVEGVRSLLVGVADPAHLPVVVAAVDTAWRGVGDPRAVTLPVRDVTLPLSLDDPSVHEAMRRYQQTVRADAPWCPDNVEFIRRVNGLARREDVFDVVTAATYLVIGLGDVYLGAPVAVPIDPGHRLVTTKYDPARPWTPENAVGIGGVYLCVYGMEGPGGYQLLGRTVPVWRYRRGTTDVPWLLRPFDRLRFAPVSAAELTRLRAEVASGERDLDARPGTLAVADLLAPVTPAAAAFTAHRQRAFAAERQRWSVPARAG